MTVTLELAPDEEAQLQANAAQKGIQKEEYLRAALRHEFQRDAQEALPAAKRWEGKSLAEALEGRIGLFSSDTAYRDQEGGEAFTDYLVQKHKEGRL